MTTNRLLRLSFALLVAIPVLALAPVARAADPPAAAAPPAARAGVARLEIEVTEIGAQRRRAARFTVALEYGRDARLHADSGPAHYKVGLRAERRDGASLLELALERIDRTPEGSVTLSLTAPVANGVRTVLAAVERADGSTLEVAVTLR